MDLVLATLSSREKASILWVGIFLIWMLSKKGIRGSLSRVLVPFFNKKLLLLYFFMIAYVGIELFLCSKIHLLDISLTKDVIFWILGTAFILLIDSNKVNGGEKYFRKKVFDSLKLVLLLEFIMNFYTFNILVEIVLVPGIFILVVMSTVAGAKDELLPAKKIIDFILAVVGVGIVIYVIANLASNFNELVTFNSVRTFIFPLILTIMYLPFIYFVALIMAYELLFVRLKVLLHHNESLITIVKKKIILLFHINLKDLNNFSSNCAKELLKVKNKKDVDDFFASLN
jgi:hypothetical protein